MNQEFSFFSEAESLQDEEAHTDEERILVVRLDKWLWAARFFKTRPVARMAIEDKKILYNGIYPKPTLVVELGAIIKIQQGHSKKTVIVRGLSTRRRNTDESLQLFEEILEDNRMTRELDHSMQVPYYSPMASEQKQSSERRPIRFLRRSFNRGEQ